MKRYVYLFFLLLSLGISHSLFAVNRYWTGNSNTDWNTANNWNPVGVPTASDNVYVNGGTGNPVIATGTTATVTSILIFGKTLTISPGATFNVRGDGGLYRYVDLNVNSTLINYGTLAMETAGGGPVVGLFGPGNDNSLVENYGIIRINSSNNNAVEMGGAVGTTPTSAIINNYVCGQFIVVSNRLVLASIASFNNTGYVYVGGSISNSGTFANSNQGVLKYGSLSGTVTNNNGSVRVNDNPTNSTIFTYTGSYSGTINGIFTNAAATTSAGSYNATNNTFTPSGLSNGSQTLYAKITPSGGACSYVVPFTYTYVAPPNFTTDPTTKSVCTGTGTTFTVAASGSPTYQWQVNTGSGFTNVTTGGVYSGATGTTLTISNVAGLNGYLYRCVATNGGGSTNSSAATLTVSSLPTAGISPSSTTLTCANPTVTLTASGGGTYRWDNNSTNAIRSVTTGGTYSVTVTNASGCTATASQTITTNTTPPTAGISPSSTTITCANPTVTLTASGGGTYRWDNNSTNAIRSVTTGGTYSVTVTNASGCTATASQTITTNTTPPTAGISPSSTTITCANPTVTLTASGGGTYRWDNNSTNAIRSVTTGGTYSVTVTAANGCTATASQTITTNTTPPTAGISPSSTTITCANPTVTLTASGGGTYRWDNNSTNAIRNVTTGGTYSVTVTSANGCTATASQTITTNTTPPTAGISPSSTTITCANPTVTLTASGGGTYRWDNNTTNAIRNVTTGGTYSVTVTATNGCTATASQTITTNTTPPTAGISPSSTTITCANPTVTLTASGGVSYRWDNNTTNAIRSVTTGGTYSVTVTSANGCTATASQTITTNTTPPTAGISPSSTTITCANPTVTLTASGGGTYRWDDNSTNAIRSVTTGGTYSVTVTSANGCTATASQTITTNTTPPTAGISPSSTTITCANPTMTLTASGGGTYRWDNNSTNAIRSVTTGGTYSVTVTAANGCTATASQTITTNTTPPTAGISPSSTTITCANPTVTLTASGGVSYRWDNNTTNAIRSVTTGGTYSVTVTNASGCTATASQTITTNTTPPTAGISPSSTTLTCANPTVTLTASGGGTYRWDNNSTNAIRSVTTGGTYSVTVTSANGCTATASQTITTNTTPPTAGISPSSTTITCANPTVTLTASSGGTYRWDDNSTNAIRNVTTGGTYSVTVTATNGCTATASQTITTNTTPPTAGISPSSTTITCANPTVTLTASGGVSYRWDNNTTNAIRSVTTGGTYSVTVTSANGCTATASQTITTNTTPPTAGISPSSTTITCANPTVTLTASGGVSYRWDNNTTNAIRSVTTGGTYSVTVTAANGCTATASQIITTNTTPPTAGISPSSTTITCANPTVTLTASSGGTYRWDDNSTNAIRNVTTGGTYSVTVTATNGCTATASQTITTNTTPPTAGISPSSTTITCANPTVTLTASGGGTYRWDDNSTNAIRSVTTGGTYSVTVTATNGCTATASQIITTNTTPPTAGISPSSTTITCANPTVTLTASGGGTYRWDDNSTNAIRSVTTGGTYSVTVTATNGCTATASQTITTNTTPPTVGISPSSTTITCTNPTVNLTASGGTAYRWDDNSTNAIRNVTTGGTYSVTVTNTSGCTATTSVQIQQDNTVPTVSISPTSATLTCANPNVTLTANGTGTYLWNTGATSQTISAGSSGTYSLTVTSANGCFASSSIQIQQDNSLPTVSISPTSATLTCANPSVTITANGSGTYQWSTGASSQTITASSAGTYSVTLTAPNGCSAATSVQIQQNNTVPTVSISPTSATLTCANPSVTLTASGTGTYLWSTGATSQTITATSAALYSVTLTGSNGCTNTASISVAADQATPPLSITASQTLLTCASPTASLIALGTGAVRWSSGSTDPQIQISTAGTYSVTLTAPSGCTTSTSITINQDIDLPTVSISPSSATLTCANPSVTLTANGIGTYQWSTGATSQTITATSAATYSVTLTADNGCSASASLSVSADQTAPSLSISPSSATLTCANPTATLTALGTGSVRWSSGSTDPQIQVSTAGTYSVTLTTPGGCTATTSVQIQQDNTVPTVSISPTSATLTCANPNVTLTANGTGTYLWNTGATSQTISAGSSGTYSLTVTSANGCFASSSIQIQQDNSLPTVSISPTSATLTCANPSVTITANGTGTYQWSTGASSQTITASSAGTYSVTLTADNGCQATVSITIEQGADQTIGFSQQPASTSSVTVGSNVSTQVVITGQASAFQWYKDNLSQPLASQTSAQLTLTNVQLSDAGSYFVVVTGPCNSLTSTAFSLSVTNAVTSLSLTASASPNPMQVGQLATLTATVSGGTSPYSYSFNGPGTVTPSGNTATVSGLTAGVYSFTVSASDATLPTAQLATTTISLTVSAVETAPFAITGVTTISCSPITPNRFSVSFTPRYSGLTGQPVSFSVANEMLPTTQPGPYTMQLYTDNATITLQASQQGTPTPTSFSYNWLEACRTSESPNTPPRVVSGLPAQTAKVGDYFTYVIPEATFTDSETPLSLRLSATGLPAGLSFAGATLSGTPSTTVGSPFTVSITATDPGGLSVSTPLVITVLPATGPVEPTAPFAITGVTTISCTPIANRINISFAPLYSGLNGQPIAFEIVNERAPTTDPAPYSLTLYRDNPVITLRARQTGSAQVASFSYNWLAACSTAGQDNTPPRLNSPVGSQTATVGKSFNLNLANTFADQETPNQLTLSAQGLPAGLVLVGTAISGTPSVSGVSTVVLTATDGGGLSNTTSFALTVSPASSTTTVTPPIGFAITGVQTVSCETVSAGLRRVSFQPQYAGVTGQAINFQVENELAATTAAGPYSLNLYTDNPMIRLKATQVGTAGEASFSYNWLAACSAPARIGIIEAETRLEVTVLGNPVEGEFVEIEIQSAPDQTIHLNVTDLQGNRISHKTLDSKLGQQRVSVRLGPEIGTYLLRVSTPTQQQTIKIIRH